MSTDIKELVKRLRDRREYQSRGHGEVVDVADGDCAEAADALEAMAAEVAGLKEAHAAELKLCDEELFRVNKQWSDMCKRAEAAEAKRDRTRADYEAMKAHNKELFGKLSAAELERDRLKAALEALEAVRSDLPEKVSEQWLYEGVRHWHHNCDWDEPRDGSPLGRGDGATVAKILNMIPRKALGGDAS